MSKVCLLCGETFPDAITFCPRDGSALRAAVQGEDLIGELFCDRYVVTDQLGSGGMGSVYLARDVRLPQQVAIKVLRDRSTAESPVVARFRQEAEAASRINHDRVARVTDFGFMADGRAYLIMEYVNGKTLRKVLEERGSFSLGETAKITEMVAEGLDAAHRLGIVHRDLKPENVMIVDDPGGGTRVKVLDFGIAKVLEADGATEHTAPGFVIGTQKWMSPEQILGTPLTAQSDVFALGLLAYAMLTGQRPYTGASDQEEMLARLSSAPTLLGKIRPDLKWPVGLQELMNRTLSRDASARPNGARAFARELSALADQHATPVSAAPVAAAGKRSMMIGVSAAIVAVLAISFVAFKLLSSADSAPDSTTIGQQPADTATHVERKTESVAAAIPTDSINAGSTPAGGSSTTVPPVTGALGDRSAKTDSKPPNRGTNAPVTAGTQPDASPKVNAPTAPDPSVDKAQAKEELERLIKGADDDMDEDLATRKRHAPGRIVQLDALLPRLTNATDRGWALYYLGTSRAVLDENAKACAAFARAQTTGSTSEVLLTGVKTQQELLRCL